MSELDALQPWLIGYFVVAAVAVTLAVAALLRVLLDVRQGPARPPVVSIAGRSAATAVSDRAA